MKTALRILRDVLIVALLSCCFGYLTAVALGLVTLPWF